MSVGFPTGVRLRTRREFDAVQQGGRRVSARYFILLARPNALACERLGIIASRKVGNAVVRNRAKRRLRDLFRRTEPDRSAAAGRRPLDLVVIARTPVASAPMAEVAADFADALRKARGERRAS
jgi:ribonuclease P protein component